MSRFQSLILALATVLVAAGASPARAAQNDATPVEKPDVVEPRERPVYGPILAEDPSDRLEIKRLYREIRILEETTMATLATLNAEMAQETDSDFRLELAKEMRQSKIDLERGNMELSLQIARLNSDTRRAAEFELALDQLNFPEKYRRPAPELPARELNQ